MAKDTAMAEAAAIAESATEPAALAPAAEAPLVGTSAEASASEAAAPESVTPPVLNIGRIFAALGLKPEKHPGAVALLDGAIDPAGFSADEVKAIGDGTLNDQAATALVEKLVAKTQTLAPEDVKLVDAFLSDAALVKPEAAKPETAPEEQAPEAVTPQETSEQEASSLNLKAAIAAIRASGAEQAEPLMKQYKEQTADYTALAQQRLALEVTIAKKRPLKRVPDITGLIIGGLAGWFATKNTQSKFGKLGAIFGGLAGGAFVGSMLGYKKLLKPFKEQEKAVGKQMQEIEGNVAAINQGLQPIVEATEQRVAAVTAAAQGNLEAVIAEQTAPTKATEEPERPAEIEPHAKEHSPTHHADQVKANSVRGISPQAITEQRAQQPTVRAVGA